MFPVYAGNLERWAVALVRELNTQATDQEIKIGMIVYAKQAPNQFYIKCDGRALKRTAYPELLKSLGTDFVVAGDANDTFRVPTFPAIDGVSAYIKARGK